MSESSRQQQRNCCTCTAPSGCRHLASEKLRRRAFLHLLRCLLLHTYFTSWAAFAKEYPHLRCWPSVTSWCFFLPRQHCVRKSPTSERCAPATMIWRTSSRAPPLLGEKTWFSCRMAFSGLCWKSTDSPRTRRFADAVLICVGGVTVAG